MGRGDVDVLVAGGGVAALEAALALRAAGQGVSVELLAPEPQFRYRPTAVAEPFGLGEVRHFELAKLASAAGAVFTPGELVSVDTTRRLAYTRTAGSISYDALLVACGARPRPAVPGAITFRGPADTTLIEQLLAEVEAGALHHIAFAVPAGTLWTLPAYELALMAAAWLAERDIAGAGLAIVSPESSPLHLFGPEASNAVRDLLEQREIAMHMGSYPAEARAGELLLVGGGVVACERAVALPRLQGPRIAGLPQTFEGFIPVDEHNRVTGVPGVYAAGDVTTFPVKQGGLATQQAEAAAAAIVADLGLGSGSEPRPFQPILRGILLTGSSPRYLHTELSPGTAPSTSTEPLWWPPAKIVGTHLTPFLAELAGNVEHTEPPAGAGVSVDVAMSPDVGDTRRDRLLASILDESHDEDVDAVGEIMSVEPLIVAPEDTIGEIAERMCDLETGSALVAEYGRLIGILTSRDLLRSLAGRTHSSEARARQWMTADPITVTPGSPLATAAALMTEHHVHHLPVVEGERPLGMVGLRDVVRAQSASPLRVGLGF